MLTQKAAKEREHEQQASNDADPWHLPVGHRAEDSLDTEGLTMASVNTAIPETNKGFQMLQKMGWKGRGLGRNEAGQFLRLPYVMSNMAWLMCHLCVDIAVVFSHCQSQLSFICHARTEGHNRISSLVTQINLQTCRSLIWPYVCELLKHSACRLSFADQAVLNALL